MRPDTIGAVEVLGIERRRLGTALLAFGLVGVILAGMTALGLLAGAFAARTLDDRLTADQAQLVTTLDQVTTTVGRLADTTAHGGDTLAATGQALGSARDVLDELAATSDELSTSLDVSILGQRPFAGAAARFANLAQRVRLFRDDAARLSTTVATNTVDVRSVADDIGRLETRLQDLSTRLKGLDGAGDTVGILVAGILIGGLLVAWVAVGAGFCAWAGWRLRGPGPPGAAG